MMPRRHVPRAGMVGGTRDEAAQSKPKNVRQSSTEILPTFSSISLRPLVL